MKDFRQEYMGNWEHPSNAFFPPIEIKEIELEKKQFRESLQVSKRFIGDMKYRGIWREEEDRLKDRMIYDLTVYVYGKDHPEKHVIRYPSDWIEALKERWSPSWMREKWPVKFTEVSASFQELYPNLTVALPDQYPVLKFAVIEKQKYVHW